MKTRSLIHLAAAMAAACIALAGCASSGDDSARPLHNSTTMVPPASATSEGSPTAGPANADPHGFVQ